MGIRKVFSQLSGKFDSLLKSGAQPFAGSAMLNGKVDLVNFKTLTLFDFSFPFSDRHKIYDALMLKLRPVVGDNISAISLFPQITESGKNFAKGIAWTASKDEVGSEDALHADDGIMWPAPLAFVPESHGCHIVVCGSGETASSICFSGGMPIMYRWGKKDGIEQWMRDYAASQGLTVDSVDNYDLASLPQEELQEHGRRSAALLGGLSRLDISNRRAGNDEMSEKFIAGSFTALKALGAAGCVVFLISALLFGWAFAGRSRFSGAPSAVYKNIFGTEADSDPVSSAGRQLRLLTGAGTRISLSLVLGNIASAFKDPAVRSIQLDSIRYGFDQTEIQGLANSMGDVESLRLSLDKNGFLSKTGDIQQIQGKGVRFSMTLTDVK